jgi:hypothetical protein
MSLDQPPSKIVQRVRFIVIINKDACLDVPEIIALVIFTIDSHVACSIRVANKLAFGIQCKHICQFWIL